MFRQIFAKIKEYLCDTSHEFLSKNARYYAYLHRYRNSIMATITVKQDEYELFESPNFSPNARFQFRYSFLSEWYECVNGYRGMVLSSSILVSPS